MLNIFATLGTHTTPTCNIVPKINAPTKYLFSKKPTLNIDSSLFILKLCTSSSSPKDKNAIVLPVSIPYKLFPKLNANNVSIPIIIPSTNIFPHNPSANIPFFASRGFLFIISLSDFSKPKAIAGIESVTKFIHNKCIASNGDFNPSISPKNIVTISPMFVAIKKCTSFLMFSKIFIPCFTAYTIVTKL